MAVLDRQEHPHGWRDDLHTIGDKLLNSGIPCVGLVRVLVTRLGRGTSGIEVVIEVDSLLAKLRFVFDPVPDVIEVEGLREHIFRMNASLLVLVNHLLAIVILGKAVEWHLHTRGRSYVLGDGWSCT